MLSLVYYWLFFLIIVIIFFYFKDLINITLKRLYFKLNIKKSFIRYYSYLILVFVLACIGGHYNSKDQLTTGIQIFSNLIIACATLELAIYTSKLTDVSGLQTLISSQQHDILKTQASIISSSLTPILNVKYTFNDDGDLTFFYIFTNKTDFNITILKIIILGLNVVEQKVQNITFDKADDQSDLLMTGDETNEENILARCKGNLLDLSNNFLVVPKRSDNWLLRRLELKGNLPGSPGMPVQEYTLQDLGLFHSFKIQKHEDNFKIIIEYLPQFPDSMIQKLTLNVKHSDYKADNLNTNIQIS